MGDVSGSKAKKRANKQRDQIRKQQQLENARLAEEDDELARAKAFRKAAGSGRSLLAKSAPTGTQTLGGA